MTGVGIPVEHTYRTEHIMSEDRVIHVVLPPRRPGSTPISDIRDAGFEVVAVAPFPEEIPGCPVAEGYPGYEQILVRESETAKHGETSPTTK